MKTTLAQRVRTWFVIHGLQLLPRLVKFVRPFRSPSLIVYKDRGYWYVRDFNGYSKAANQLVCGVPELIEHWAGPASSTVRLTYSDRPLQGAHVLKLVESDAWGSTYHWLEGETTWSAWLCPVFFWYFPSAPETLYVVASALGKGESSK